MSNDVVELDCGHYAMSPRKHDNSVGADVRCPVCNVWRIAMHVWKEQWHSRCTVCRYGRSHGLAKVYAERAAAEHFRKTGHETRLAFYSDAPKAAKATAVSVVRLPGQHAQPTLFDEPPF